jgi:hypothetical protein
MEGFSEEWCALINIFVCGRRVAIKVNNDISKYFQTKKVYDKVTHYRSYYLI